MARRRQVHQVSETPRGFGQLSGPTEWISYVSARIRTKPKATTSANSTVHSRPENHPRIVPVNDGTWRTLRPLKLEMQCAPAVWEGSDPGVR